MTTYTAEGCTHEAYVLTNCGHHHRTLQAAIKCLNAHRWHPGEGIPVEWLHYRIVDRHGRVVDPKDIQKAKEQMYKAEQDGAS